MKQKTTSDKIQCEVRSHVAKSGLESEINIDFVIAKCFAENCSQPIWERDRFAFVFATSVNELYFSSRSKQVSLTNTGRFACIINEPTYLKSTWSCIVSITEFPKKKKNNEKVLLFQV